MQLLHVDSSITGTQSVSRQLTAEIVAKLRQATPDLDVTYRDLAAEPVPHLSGSILAARQPAAGQPSVEVEHDLVLSALDHQEAYLIGLSHWLLWVSWRH